MTADDIFKLGSKLEAVSAAVALPFFEVAAEKGDQNAQYSLASILLKGQLGQVDGIQDNEKRAAKLYAELAMKGHPYAQVCTYCIFLMLLCIFLYILNAPLYILVYS